VSDNQLSDLYRHLRCGLFHNGMSGEAIVLNRTLKNAIEFYNRVTIDINHSMFLAVIILDFNQYISDLNNQNNIQLRNHFDVMYLQQIYHSLILFSYINIIYYIMKERNYVLLPIYQYVNTVLYDAAANEF